MRSDDAVVLAVRILVWGRDTALLGALTGGLLWAAQDHTVVPWWGYCAAAAFASAGVGMAGAALLWATRLPPGVLPVLYLPALWLWTPSPARCC
ncbi:MAG: hypothetical protein R3F59_27805 [Myxococcota bacterium]